MKHGRSLRWLAVAAFAFAPLAASSDAFYDWPALASVHRVAVLPPFVCPHIIAVVRAERRPPDYLVDLHSLEATLAAALPRSIGTEGNARLDVTDPAEVARALRTLHLTAPDCCAGHAEPAADNWPAPDVRRAQAICRRLRVDAVLFAAMREPASIGEGVQVHHDPLSINPINWRLQRIRTHVLSPRVRATLVTRDGVIAWKDEEMADHPRSKSRTAHTLLLDWQEATAQVAQQLADSLCRLPPPASGRRR